MLWEMLMLEGFQTGLACITVLKKRNAFRIVYAWMQAVGIVNDHSVVSDGLI